MLWFPGQGSDPYEFEPAVREDGATGPVSIVGSNGGPVRPPRVVQHLQTIQVGRGCGFDCYVTGLVTYNTCPDTPDI